MYVTFGIINPLLCYIIYIEFIIRYLIWVWLLDCVLDIDNNLYYRYLEIINIKSQIFQKEII